MFKNTRYLIIIVLSCLTSLAFAGEPHSTHLPQTKHLDGYLNLVVAMGQTLATDKTTGLAQQLVELKNTATKLDQELSHFAGNHPATALRQALTAAKSQAVDTSSITSIRKGYQQIATPLANYIAKYGIAGAQRQQIFFFECSMAKGSWLQADKQTKNPYFGAKMLGCATKTLSIQQ